jgi:hypothetical protein
MPSSKYQVRFKLLGGATVTKVLTASNEKDAANRAVKTFKAVEILSIKKV